MTVNRVQKKVQGVQERRSDFESFIHPGENADLFNFSPKSSFKMGSKEKSLKDIEQVASSADARTPPLFRS